MPPPPEFDKTLSSLTALLAGHPLDLTTEGIGPRRLDRSAAKCRIERRLQKLMLDVSARAVVVDRPVIEQFVIRVKEIYLGCYGRSEFVRDHIARVDQHRKRVPLGRIRRDPLERFRIAVVRVYPDKADPLSFIGFGQLVDPVDICLYHRALCRQKDQDRAVLSAQAVK